MSNREHPKYGRGREALIDAFVRVASRQGLRNATIRAVSDEAAVTHGLVRYHFGSVDLLLHEATVYAAEQSRAQVNRHAAAGDLNDVASRLGANVAANPDPQAFQYELFLEARRRPELRLELLSLYDTYLSTNANRLRRAGIEPSPAIVRLVTATIEGLVLLQLIYEDEDATTAAFNELLSLLAPLMVPIEASDDTASND